MRRSRFTTLLSIGLLIEGVLMVALITGGTARSPEGAPPPPLRVLPFTTQGTPTEQALTEPSRAVAQAIESPTGAPSATAIRTATAPPSATNTAQASPMPSTPTTEPLAIPAPQQTVPNQIVITFNPGAS